MTEASNIFDRIAIRIFEAKANTKAEAVAICINEAGLDALWKAIVMTCIYCNDTPGIRENCYCRDATTLPVYDNDPCDALDVVKDGRYWLVVKARLGHIAFFEKGLQYDTARRH